MIDLITDLNPVARFPFDGNMTSDDGSISGHDKGAGFAEGMLGKAAVFLGDERVEIPARGLLRISGEEISYAFWIKVADYSTNAYAPIISWHTPGEASRGWGAFIHARPQKTIEFVVNGGVVEDSPESGQKHINGPEIEFGVWRHYAFTYSIADGMKAYFDGELVATQPDYDRPFGESSSDTIWVGGIADGTWEAFTICELDELWLFDRRLSASEVRAIFEFDPSEF